MLLIDVTPFKLIFAIVTALIGVIAISAALTGFFTSKMHIIERLLFFAGGLMLLTTNRYLNLAAMGILVVGYLLQKRKHTKATVA